MRKGYTIKSLKATSNGFVEEVLGKDSKWYVAANNCSFSTLREARQFFKTSNCEWCGMNIWIEGPRKGRHFLFERK